jgi:serralysin
MTGWRFVDPTGNAATDGVLSGYAWDGTMEFSFPTASWQYFYDPEPLGLVPFSGSAAQPATPIWAALRSFDEVAGLIGTALTWNTAAPQNADIKLAMTTVPDGGLAGFAAYAYLPAGAPEDYAGDAWFNTAQFNTPIIGTFGHFAIAHEIGHTLGLKHGHEAEGIFPALPFAQDSMEFSVMTYRTFVGQDVNGFITFADGHAPQGYMMLDIAGLQRMYGADYGFRATDTLYRFDPATGEMLVDGVGQGVARNEALGLVNVLFRTVWDGGGNDTYDFSLYDATRQLQLDLRPGEWTDVDADSNFQAANLGGGPNGGYARGQVANALLHNNDPRALIENAIGGAGDDRFIGNQAVNVLQGRGGNDRFLADPSADTLDGGLGIDSVDLSLLASRAVINLSITGPQNTQAGGLDTLISIENITGSDHNDVLVGNALDNVLAGGAGNDVIEGRGGNDTLLGGEGTDTAEYRTAASGVVVSLLMTDAQHTEGAGLDTLSGFENLTGSAFDDVLTGEAGNNVLAGLAGNDILQGGPGIDRLDGGEGMDLASYAGAPGPVTVYLNASSSTGSAGVDYFVAIEGFLGSVFNDTLVGNAGANVLRGDAGDDRLFGLDGDDMLRGGAGYDLFYGGTGTDTADYADATVTVRAVLGTGGTVDTINFGRDWYFDIENLAGGMAKDFLTGDANANRIDGNGGDDILAGGGGDDHLLGGAGNDQLTGGLGADIIDLGTGFDIVRYGAAAESRAAGMDRLVNFTQSGGDGFDRIGFENAAGALFAGVAPTAITLGPRRAIDQANLLDDLLAQIVGLAASTTSLLALTQVDVLQGDQAGRYLVVNDSNAAFDAGTDMLLALGQGAPSNLSAGNFFLF